MQIYYNKIFLLPKEYSARIIASSLVFIFSLLIYPHYTLGDQFFYRNFYASALDFGFIQSYIYYQSVLGSAEPGYFLLIRLFSGFIQKDILMSFLNGFLAYILIFWAQKNKVSWLAITPLFFNFYLFVLFFSAERLKLGILFLMLAVNYAGPRRFIFSAISFISHVQTMVLIVNWMSLKVLPILKSLLHGRLKKSGWKILLLLGVSLLLVSPLLTHVSRKFDAYSSRSRGFFELFKPAIFLLLTLYYAKREFVGAILMHLPVLFGAFLLGGDRLVIFSYFIFLSYALKISRGINTGVAITSIYFLTQGLLYIYNVIQHGDGFYGIAG